MSVPFDQLDAKQKQVVRYKGGPLLVLAGPGTGKTEVLTHRIAYLITHMNEQPKEILAVTFSRKATNEMAERLKEFKGLEEAQPRVSTLHAESLRILDGLGRSRKFLVADDEATLLMRDASEDLGLDIGARERKELEKKVKLLKANNKIPDEIFEGSSQDRVLKAFYDRYEQLLAFNRAIDLDGLILKVVRILSCDDSSSGSYQLQPRHLLVDEYQDINQVMYNLIQILARNIETLFVVGDDDQSIYSWRGADPTIIRNFHQDFQSAQIQILEKSHRCPEHILKGAQAIVSKDLNYVPKPFSSSKGEGSPIHILLSRSYTREALWITKWINDHLSKNFVKPKDIVIICKDLKLADLLMEQLRIARINATRWRSGGLFTDRAFREILAYLRIFVARDDNLALRRCMKGPTGKGIGDVGVCRLRRIAERYQCSLWEVMMNVNRYRQLKIWREKFRRFAGRIQELHERSTKLKLYETIDLIAKEIGASKLNSVDKLKTFAASFPEEMDLASFLQEVNKNRGIDLAGGGPEPEEKRDAVALMSMHSAKGLNYDVVFLLGMDEGILPDRYQDMNEQRRLCYVAMTRARKELFLCHARLRKGPAARGWGIYVPSRFLREIPKEHREIIRS